MSDTTKAKEVTAYEDSWYRSLKALADMRPVDTDVRPVDAEIRPAEADVRPVENDEETAEALED